MTSNETDEIEKIMSEIEELQKEMAPSSDVAAITASTLHSTAPELNARPASLSGIEDDILREIQTTAHSGGNEGGLEETLGELHQEEAAGGMLAAVDQGENMSQPNSNGDGTLSLTLTGNMTLKLKYEFEGQEVTISFVDQALRVQMTDGTEFKVPVVRNQAASQARSSNIRPFKKAV